MVQNPIEAPRSQRMGVGRVFTWLIGAVSFGVLLSVLFLIAYQMIIPPPARRVLLVRDIPLPSGLGKASPGQTDPLAPGSSLDFDGFDFQAIDPLTHLLFIAHTGPAPDAMILAHIPFDPTTDGHILVFDLRQQKLIGRVPIPQVSGIVVAPDLHRVFAADSENNRIYSFDETAPHPIFAQLPDNEGPDAMSYDPVDHKIFVSDPGAPVDIYKDMNADRNNQNVFVIDALTTRVITHINIGNLTKLPSENAPVAAKNAPKFGMDVGHNKYDEVLHRLYVVTQILPDANDPAGPLPPAGTAEFVTIDPVANRIISRTVLPESCSTPHGMTVDTQQHVAFVVCTDVDPDRHLLQHLLRMDVQTLKPFPEDPDATRINPAPDMAILDHPLHLVFIACNSGMTIFDVSPGHFHKLGDYAVDKGTHTMAIDEQTQLIYMPVASAGGRPVLHIAKYNPNGI
ncbi:MAG: hypothetical protein H0W02_05345 [Ktedonobacteraceae bacterium]|nr:hypothetical protein [Ktedonobacteraceae bacterium]